MTQSENNSENGAKSGGLFGSIRSVLVIVMIGFLLYSLGKDNPRVQAIFHRFSSAQQAADPSAVLKIGGETMGTFYTVQIAACPRAWDAEKLHRLVEGALCVSAAGPGSLVVALSRVDGEVSLVHLPSSSRA